METCAALTLVDFAVAPGSSVDRRQRGYVRHRPEETLLYKLVAEHLETFLAESREKHDRPLPTYVERELRAYLRCGILSDSSHQNRAART